MITEHDNHHWSVITHHNRHWQDDFKQNEDSHVVRAQNSFFAFMLSARIRLKSIWILNLLHQLVSQFKELDWNTFVRVSSTHTCKIIRTFKRLLVLLPKYDVCKWKRKPANQIETQPFVCCGLEGLRQGAQPLEVEAQPAKRDLAGRPARDYTQWILSAILNPHTQTTHTHPNTSRNSK